MKTEKGDLGKKTWERGAEGRVGAWDFSLSRHAFSSSRQPSWVLAIPGQKCPSSSIAAPSQSQSPSLRLGLLWVRSAWIRSQVALDGDIGPKSVAKDLFPRQ